MPPPFFLPSTLWRVPSLANLAHIVENSQMHATPDDFDRFHKRFISKEILGRGYFGEVEDVEYVCAEKHFQVRLARKRIQCRRNVNLEKLRQEGKIMEKVKHHHHVVKFVGSYCERRGRSEWMYLLSWPVAACSLDEFLQDIETLREKEAVGLRDAQKQMEDLGLSLDRLSSQDGPESTDTHRPGCMYPMDFLRSILGCITNALAFCHQNGVRHRDIKPHNILVDRGTVLLTDFGISMDASDADSTWMTGNGGTKAWCAPEVVRPDRYSPRKAEIYSLGLIFLKVATVLYGGDVGNFNNAVRFEFKCWYPDLPLKFARDLRPLALATPSVRDDEDGTVTCGPRHLVGLICRMLDPVPENRPDADHVSRQLVELGGVGQIYMGCDRCKLSPGFMAEIFDNMHRKDKMQLQAMLEQNAKALARAESERSADIEKAKAEAVVQLQSELKLVTQKLEAQTKSLESLTSDRNKMTRRAEELASSIKLHCQEKEDMRKTTQKYQMEHEKIKAEVSSLRAENEKLVRRNGPGRRLQHDLPNPGKTRSVVSDGSRKQSDASLAQLSQVRAKRAGLDQPTREPSSRETTYAEPLRLVDAAVKNKNPTRPSYSTVAAGRGENVRAPLNRDGVDATATPSRPGQPPSAAPSLVDANGVAMCPPHAELLRVGSSSKLPRLSSNGIGSPSRTPSRSGTPKRGQKELGTCLLHHRSRSGSGIPRSPVTAAGTSTGNTTNSSTSSTTSTWSSALSGQLRVNNSSLMLEPSTRGQSPRLSQSDNYSVTPPPTRIPNPSSSFSSSSLDSGISLGSADKTLEKLAREKPTASLDFVQPLRHSTQGIISVSAEADSVVSVRKRSPSLVSQARSVLSDASIGSRKSYRDAVPAAAAATAFVMSNHRLPSPGPDGSNKSTSAAPARANVNLPLLPSSRVPVGRNVDEMPADSLRISANDKEADLAPPMHVTSVTFMREKSWADVVASAAKPSPIIVSPEHVTNVISMREKSWADVVTSAAKPSPIIVSPEQLPQAVVGR